MLAAFGVDVLDPATSTRRVHVLLERLPPSARRGGEDWSTEAELLAGLIDHVAQLTYVTLQANGAKGVPRPKPVARPRRRGYYRTPDPAPVPAGSPDHLGKAATWFDAAAMLTRIPGVVTDGQLRLWRSQGSSLCRHPAARTRRARRRVQGGRRGREDP